MLERLEPFIGEWDLEPSFPTLPGAVAMSRAAAHACQGATFTVYLKVGP